MLSSGLAEGFEGDAVSLASALVIHEVVFERKPDESIGHADESIGAGPTAGDMHLPEGPRGGDGGGVACVGALGVALERHF